MVEELGSQDIRNSTNKVFHNPVMARLMADMLASQILRQCFCVPLLPEHQVLPHHISFSEQQLGSKFRQAHWNSLYCSQ